ncbi:holo-ACP synthase [Paenibacillus sp. Marseille-Q4541]|uniref:holo-ACP synthase n=1 Tax=Paenibacillus sp. Marseille-Q4541 TaxID=2831522 RepID=UPI001BACF52A|nr:holo-ACP synthase [Paenibacillus sp. Marseille-Q4541]
MIYGIGNDVLETGRIRRILESNRRTSFIKRVLTSREQEILFSRSKDELAYVSGRFAAKEAVTKAFGCGIGQMIGFHDLEILPDEKGKPVVSLSAEAWKRLELRGEPVYQIHLSISHQPAMAAAFAIVERIEQIH